MSAKHTPGPWEVGPYKLKHGSVPVLEIRSDNAAGHRWIAYVQEEMIGGQSGEANANLIALSPEMLEAIEKDVARFGRIRDILAETMVPDGTAKAELMDYVLQCQIESRALIARAEGGQS